MSTLGVHSLSWGFRWCLERWVIFGQFGKAPKISGQLSRSVSFKSIRARKKSFFKVTPLICHLWVGLDAQADFQVASLEEGAAAVFQEAAVTAYLLTPGQSRHCSQSPGTIWQERKSTKRVLADSCWRVGRKVHVLACAVQVDRKFEIRIVNVALWLVFNNKQKGCKDVRIFGKICTRDTGDDSRKDNVIICMWATSEHTEGAWGPGVNTGGGWGPGVHTDKGLRSRCSHRQGPEVQVFT